MAPEPTDERYEQARQRVEAKMGFFSHLAVYVLVNVVFLIIAGSDWLWVTLFWGIGLALHAWQVFFAGSGRIAAWKEQQIQKELQRTEAAPAAPADAAAAPEASASTEASGADDAPTS